MTSLKIGILQLDTQWENPTANKSTIEEELAGLKGHDLVVLPEMFLTGFSCSAVGQADFEAESTTQWMRELAKKKSLALMGSVKTVNRQQKLQNRLLLVEADGRVQSYNKRHLFALSDESKNFQAGSERMIFILKDWRICPQVCYDLRFPVWSRNDLNYDLLINVANWPSSRHHAWRSLLIARAIENQAYVLGVNRRGIDDNQLLYNGGSLAIDPMGDIMSDVADTSGIVSVEFDKTHIVATRQRLPFLKDQDTFAIRT